jgi:hypothetical protein
LAETQDRPCQVTSGDSQERRPALKQFVRSPLGVERAVPMGGKPAAGKASDKPRKTTLVAEITQLFAPQGVQPGAYRDIADSALVMDATLAALRDPWGLTRCPATSSACGRVSAEAVACNPWEEVGGRAPTPPTKHRPGTCYSVAERSVT